MARDKQTISTDSADAPSRVRTARTEDPPRTSTAARNVQEAAAEVRRASASLTGQASETERIAATKETERIALAYFRAIDDHEIDTAVSLWAPGGRGHVRGLLDATAPEGVRTFLNAILDAIPDLRLQVVKMTAQNDRCGVQWRLTGTFSGPGSLRGVAPTGHPLVLEGIDLLTIRDGQIQANDAFSDSISVSRQIGMMPALDSAPERLLTRAFNVKTHLAGRVLPAPARIAPGVWMVQGQPGRCNVYLIENDSAEGGVTMFDAGARTMVRAVATAGAQLGGIRRIILGHGHTDHRGTAPALQAPVLSHADEVRDAEGSGGFRYWPVDLEGLPTLQRHIHRLLHRVAWDGGPVKISGTLSEGEEVPGGFRVVELPGHAPGLIALFRDRDRLALCTDAFYTLDMWGRHCSPTLPVGTYNYDTAGARESLLKLADMRPAVAWSGHGKPVTSDVRSALTAAARG